MNQALEKRRDELAKEHSEVYTDNDFRIRAHVGFECGFDKACDILLPLLKEAEKSLEFYAYNWNATMPKEAMYDGLKEFGERARQALYKIESVIGEVSK